MMFSVHDERQAVTVLNRLSPVLCPSGHGRPRAVVSYGATAERPIPGRAFIICGTAQRAPCRTAFNRALTKTSDVRRESYRL